MTKECLACGERKPVEAFTQSSTVDGYRYSCNSCSEKGKTHYRVRSECGHSRTSSDSIHRFMGYVLAQRLSLASDKAEKLRKAMTIWTG